MEIQKPGDWLGRMHKAIEYEVKYEKRGRLLEAAGALVLCS